MTSPELSFADRGKWLNIHAHKRLNSNEVVVMSCSPRMAVFAARTGDVPVSAGLHPWHMSPDTDLASQLDLLAEATGFSGVVAIGEAGLDRAIDMPVIEQEKVFVAQAEVAAGTGRPVIIHCVRAIPDIIRLRKKFASAPPWIIHGFGGNEQEAAQLIKHDIYISFGASLTGNRKKTLAAARALPVEKVFFETDEADIEVKEVYRVFSRFRGTDPDRLREQVWDNFLNVFGSGEGSR